MLAPIASVLPIAAAMRFGTAPTMAAPTGKYRSALLFDCDGVIVETEELHRLAYNEAFNTFGLEVGGEPVNWSVEYYDVLANTVGGGKPKMRYHFTQTVGEWPAVTKRDVPTPADEAAGMALIDDLQDCKTEAYKRLVSQASPRPGILEMMDAAIADEKIAVGICSASTRAGFEKVVDAIVGQPRLEKLDLIIAGDDVKNKKPDPEIYNLAASRLGLPNTSCLVVEDSLVGLRAARGAGMRCVITYLQSTDKVDFYAEGADAKLLDLREGPGLDALFDGDGGIRPELLESFRDPK